MIHAEPPPDSAAEQAGVGWVIGPFEEEVVSFVVEFEHPTSPMRSTEIQRKEVVLRKNLGFLMDFISG